MSSNTPWHTDRWFTSPWNHDPEMGDLQFPSQIEIHDVTLRDGEQQAGVEFRAEDKIRIAEALAEAGIQRIEAGLPAVSDEDEKAVREIASRDLGGTKVYAFSRCMVDDVKKAIDCGVHGVVMEIPSSKHLIELGYRWSLERAIDLSIEATSFAHDAGLQVSFFPIDATRASVTDYLNLVERVATDGHVDALGLVDTFGVLTPHAVERFVKVSRDRLNVPLETHFHQDYGLGVANSLIAAAAGAACLQTTVGGLGERAGNTPTEETVLALLTLYNQDIGIKTEKLTGVSRLVMELAGESQPGNRPITGETLFNVESGIIAAWVRNVRGVDTTEVVPYLPSLVGQPGPTIVLGKGSGIDNIAEGLERLGLEASDEQKMEMLQQVKSKSLEKRDLLNDDEFREIAEDVLGTRA